MTVARSLARWGPPVVVDSAQTIYGTANASRSVTFSATAQQGDLVFMWIASTTTATVNSVTGWTNQLGAGVDIESDSHQAAFFWQEVTTPGTTFTLSNVYGATEVGIVIGALIRGASPRTTHWGGGDPNRMTTIFDSGNAVTAHLIPSITPIRYRSLVLGFVCSDGTGTYTTPSGWVALQTISTTQSAGLYRLDNADPGISAIAQATVTISSGNEYIGMAHALAPIVPYAFIPPDHRTPFNQAVYI